MSTTHKTSLRQLRPFLLCFCLVLVLSGDISAGWGSSAQHKEWIEISVRVLDIGVSTETDFTSVPVSFPPHYLLLHSRGHIVAQGLPGEAVLPYQRVWLKGTEQIFDTLAAEEQRFSEVRLSGLLHEHRPGVGILELARVDVAQTKSGANK